MDLNEIFSMAPVIVFPIVAWLAYRVQVLETQILQDIRSDITEVKNDIRWLIKYHEKEE